MTSYRITDGSVETAGRMIRCKAVYIRDSGEESHEQLVEAEGGDVELYKALDTGAEQWEASAWVKKDNFTHGENPYTKATATPVMTTGKSVEVGVETKKASDARAAANP